LRRAAEGKRAMLTYQAIYTAPATPRPVNLGVSILCRDCHFSVFSFHQFVALQDDICNVKLKL
jgi:hypothetical protein